MKPIAVMVPVADWDAGFSWYQKAFPKAKILLLPEFNFRALDIDGFVIEVVSSDDKVSNAMAGTVLYWQVDNLQAAIKHFKSLGSLVYRGPMQIEQGLGMCQVTDTFGNLIGLRGPQA